MTVRRQRQRGFSLIEGLLASGILAIAASALLLPFTVEAANNVLLTDHAAAVGLAEALMEEVLAKPFDDAGGPGGPGPEPGETGRAQFDNMDDYDGYSESAGQLRDASGALIADASLSMFARAASVTYVRLPGQDAGQLATFVRIIVQVSEGGRALHRVTRLAGRR